jgi:hypothetical protein
MMFLEKSSTMRCLLKKPTMSGTCPKASLLQENKTPPSKLARRARARKWWKNDQVKKKKMMMMIREPSMIPMRWLSS